jgi:uncharacterized cupin superfamily protein
VSAAGRPPFIVARDEVPETLGSYPGSDEVLSPGRPIGKVAGLQRIGVHIERVPPGMRTSWPHAEADEEEFVYVLEGEIDAWIDGTLHRMVAGDFAAFPAGTGICHTFMNNGAADALLLAGGEASKPGSRIFYPLHPERRAAMKPGRWWEDVPARPRGDHDGLPDALRARARVSPSSPSGGGAPGGSG